MDSTSRYIKQLIAHDFDLKWIDFDDKRVYDSCLFQLMDTLIVHPDVVTDVHLGGNQLTNETGFKLGRYLAVSSTVHRLDLSNNQFGKKTYLAVATALCRNSSLRVLFLHENRELDQTPIDIAFVNSLRINPSRPDNTQWWLHPHVEEDFKRLKSVAEKSTPPSMLEFLLYVHLDTEKIKTKIH